MTPEQVKNSIRAVLTHCDTGFDYERLSEAFKEYGHDMVMNWVDIERHKIAPPLVPVPSFPVIHPEDLYDQGDHLIKRYAGGYACIQMGTVTMVVGLFLLPFLIGAPMILFGLLSFVYGVIRLVSKQRNIS